MRMLTVDKVNKVILFLLILLLPTQLGQHFFLPFSYLSGVRIDYLAPTLYLTDILCVSLIILNGRVLLPILKKKESIVFFVLLGLNIVFSLSYPLAVYKSVRILEILSVFFIVKHLYLKQLVEDKLLLLGFLTGGFAELLLSTVQVVTKHSVQGVFYYLGERYFNLSTPGIAKVSLQGVEILRAYGTFSHPNSLAGFYLLIYFFVLSNKKFSSHFLLKYGTLLCSALLIFLSFSKIAIVIFLILNILYTLTHRKEIKCLFCIVSRILVLSIVGLLFFSAQGDVTSLEKRLQLVQNSFSIFIHHPIFGVGLGNYLVAQNEFPIKYSFFFLQPVHNIFLLLLSEGGIVLFGYVSFQLFQFFKTYLKNETFLYVATIVILTGMFDHYWLTLQQNMLPLPVIFALL